MKKFSFKNRIASNYIFTTGLLICVVFFAIYTIVKFSVYNHVNTDIAKEVQNHLNEIEIKNNAFFLIHMEEWMEREHNTVDVNPVFIQFLNNKNEVVEKSPNLKKQFLHFNKDVENNELFDTTILKNKIRQIQVPIYDKKEVIGYLVIAMSLEDASMVLHNLSEILIIAFPLILIILFLIARFIAGRSIKPISAIIETSNIITKDNLKSRIPLPAKKDELYILSQTINNLLNRIETAVEREKQFTSDASHELRTPLTVIKGTLEVLIRKPRNNEEYQEKINYCITEVNRLNTIVDQLLLLARYENNNQSLKIEKISLNTIIMETLSSYATLIDDKNMQINTQLLAASYINNDRYLVAIIINNLISNAVKYSRSKDQLTVIVKEVNGQVICEINDTGIGIPTEDLKKIFNPFFRSQSIDQLDIKGNGLGLSIVSRLCELLKIEISVSSQLNEGTQVKLHFN
ncbi:sensor histidine kinase [Flavobacterium muglaense]|uniref:histidine kinase n=1 Tax=Flavobacterium muglaense TaxID=2764716 RepID=A0A923MYX4_9FLAO|nr:HAMP domain-containing sensor histidine kinase [Flavobacterium muglaense]MBC5837668.1 HAMP domain-containing histidine kinase [Flavobacterium muglaense]MBC5844216.1 HAMP domain-containing histidine kinase [Flavobacterium muglaense]